MVNVKSDPLLDILDSAANAASEVVPSHYEKSQTP